MLANGTLLGYRKHNSSENYKNLEGLKTVPDVGKTPELVENTPIAATNKRYEPGVGDLGSMEYTFVYEGNVEGSTYRQLREAGEKNLKLDFKETWTDGTTITYTAIPALTFTRGGGINTVIDLKVTMAVCSDIVTHDPDEDEGV